jgi:hypothetical protein
MNEAKLPPLPDENDNSLGWHALNYRTAHTMHAQAMYEELERYVREYGALCARQATESIADALSDALQSDLENGVKWLNERASERFTADYPELRKAIAAILAQPQTGGSADE